MHGELILQAHEGEYIPASESLQALNIQPHPFADPGMTYVRAGKTLQAMLLECTNGKPLHDHIVVRINGIFVPRELWPRVKPKPGTHIYVGVNMLAGGNGNGLRTALQIVVAVVAAWVTGGAGGAIASSGWAAAAGAAVMIGGTLLVNQIAPLQTASTASANSSKAWYQLTGSSNAMTPWEIIPQVLGEYRIYPRHAATPYSEYVGGSLVYQHGLLDLGFLNPGYVVEGDKIGDTDIGDYDGVTREVTTDPTLYQNDNTEMLVNASLDEGPESSPANGTEITRTTASNTEHISLNIVMTRGLEYVNNSDGKKYEMAVYFKVQYRSHSAGGAFQDLPANTVYSFASAVSGNSSYNVMIKTWAQDPLSFGIAFDPAIEDPNGEYDVYVKRAGASIYSYDTDRTVLSDCVWYTMTSMRYANPSTTGTVKLAYRILATDQLNGTLDNYSVLVRNTYRPYDMDSGWGDYGLTLNRAWISLDVLTAPSPKGFGIPESEIHFQSFCDYAQWHEAHDLEYRDFITTGANMRDTLNKILSGGMASLDFIDGKYGVTWDRNAAMPSATLMPLEIANFAVQRSYARVPHALRVTFINPGNDWASDEIVVLRDGYSLGGKDAYGNSSSAPEATEFETYDAAQAMSAQQAWMLGRYTLATAQYQSITYTWDSDIAGLGIHRGDFVKVYHDVAAFGVGFARVKSLAAGGYNGAEATLTLDAEIETELGTSYSARIRNAIGESVLITAVPHSPQSDTFYLSSLPDGIEFGDGVTIVATESEPEGVLITRIKRKDAQGNFSFIAVNKDARVYPYWQNPPESIESSVNSNRYAEPSIPFISAAVSAPANDTEDDGGVKRATLRISVQSPNSPAIIPTATVYELRYRLVPVAPDTEMNGWVYQRFTATTSIQLVGILRGRTYDLNVRAESASGALSDWSQTYSFPIPDTNRTGSLALSANTAQKAGVWNASTAVSYSLTSTSASISLTDAVLTIEGKSIAYSNASVNVSGSPLAQKTFWLYFNDPELQGGTRVLHASEDYEVAIGTRGNIIVFPLDLEFPDAGNTGGGSGGVGGGGSLPPGCPQVNMLVEEETRGWIRIGDLKRGDVIRLWSGDFGAVDSARNLWRPGYRITTSNGVVLECSDTAPLRVPGGKMQAQQLQVGMPVCTHADTDGVSSISSIEFIGIIEVMEITCQRTFYRVGKVAGATLDHHNAFKALQ